MLLAAHISRHGTLTEWLDGSILDEADPTQTRSRSSTCTTRTIPIKPPYSQEFLARYRQAQIDRNRRITAWVKEKLAELRVKRPPRQRCRRVRIRRPRHHGRPALARPDCRSERTGPRNLLSGRSSSGEHEPGRPWPDFRRLRSWLSQWSYDDAHGDGVDCGRDVAVPALVIGNLADDACTPESYSASLRGDRPSRQGDVRNPRCDSLLRRPRSTRPTARGRHGGHRLAGTA